MSEPAFDTSTDAGGLGGAGAAEPSRLVDTALLGTDQDPVEVLRSRVGQVVSDHPGVLRLEPTLLGAVQSLARGGSLDGIQLVTHGRVVDLDVNVATRADHQARATAIELHRQLTALVTQQGWVPGTLEISVLRIEEPA
ncbi:hypothetical protein GCM10022197_05420 [Microlunatus spumicola]|uniref:Asp23 family, cell envelope-related function n=1 Tax=Microlunatus spumicola TaxID=81499 RepID=A0ABP6WM28_9ACTN